MIRAISIFALGMANTLSNAADPVSPFKAGKSGAGECFFVSDIPVIVLRGTPVEVGRQYAELVAPAGKILISELDEILAGMGWTKFFPTMKTLSSFLYSRFPIDHRTELEAIAKSSKIDSKLLIFATTVPDLMKIGGCSTLVIEAKRSTTGNLLFGRNLDWPPVGSLPKLTAVVVTHIKGNTRCCQHYLSADIRLFLGHERRRAVSDHERDYLDRRRLDSFRPGGHSAGVTVSENSRGVFDGRRGRKDVASRQADHLGQSDHCRREHGHHL